MTSITRNLPPFVRDLGVSIVGEVIYITQKCYTSLVEDLNLSDAECLKYALSKGLGVGIVAGGSIMKIPQLLTILSSGSARGLSLPASVLETLSYGVTLAYSVRNNFPFSTYGENLFLTIQNVLISILVAFLSSNRSLYRPLTVAALFGASSYVLYNASDANLALFQLATLPLSLASKFPQIAQNARARSTGQLSAFAVFSQLLGSLARLFTTMTEVGDIRMSAGFALACALNAVLAYQVFAYGSAPVIEPIPIDVRSEQKTGSVLAEKGTGPIQWGAEAPGSKPTLPRTGSPVQRYGSPQPGRKWSRKVD